MENYDRTVELIDTAYDSAGRSSEQFAKYQDTVEYKLKQLSNTWEQLRTNFLSSDTYKGFIDFANKFVKTINNMDLKQILTVGTIGLTLGRSVINQFILGLKGSVNALSTAWNSTIESSINKINMSSIGIKLSKKINEKNIAIATNALTNVGVNSNIIQDNTELILQYTQIKQKLIEINNEIQKIDAKGDLINNDERERLALLKQQSKELKEQKILRARKLQNAGLTPRQINDASLNRELQTRAIRRNNITNVRTTVQGTVTNALSASITSALMMAISGADLGTVISTAGISALTSAIPTVITSIAPKIISFLTGPAGIVIAISGALALITKKIQEKNEIVRDTELKRLQSVEETNKKLQDKQLKSLKESISIQKQNKTFEDAYSTYQELSEKSFLNSEEQEELNSAFSTLTEDFEDVVVNFDENTKEIIFNTVAIEKLRKDLEEQDVVAQKEAKIAGTQSYIEYIQNANVLRKDSSDLSKFIRTRDNLEISDSGYLSWEEYPGGDRISTKDTVTKKHYNYDEIKQILDSFEGNENLLNNLKITKKDYSTLTDFQDYIEDFDGGMNAFLSTLSNAENELAKIFDNTALIKAREAATNQYLNMTIDGEQISEELAKSLSYSIDSNDILKVKDLAKDMEEDMEYGIEDNKNFLRDYLQRIQENDLDKIDTYIQSEFQNIEIGDTNVDAIIKEKMAEWEDNNQELMSGFDGNLSEWTQLPEDFREYLDSIKHLDEDSFNKMRKNASESRQLVADFFYSLILAEQEAFIGISEEQIKDNQDQLLLINNLLSDMGNYTEETFLNLLLNYVENLDQETRDAILHGQGLKYENGQLVKLTDKELSELSIEIEDTAYNKFEQVIEKFKDLDIDVNGFKDKINLSTQEAILDTIAQANLSQDSQQQLAKSLIGQYSGLKTETQNILSGINIVDKSYMTLASKSQEYIKAIRDTGEYSLEQAAKIYSDYIETATEYLTKPIYNKAGVELLRNQYDEYFKNTQESYESLIEAQNEFAENGSISSKTYFNLLENGFKEYVKITKNGYELINNTAEQAWVNATMLPLKDLERNFNENKKLLQTAKKMQKSIHTNDIDNFASMSKNEFENAQSNFQELSSEIQDYILVLRNADMTQKDFIKSLEQSNIEIEKLKSEIYIQGLINLTEAMDLADDATEDIKEEIEDLNGELEDLNKELEDLQEQLIEDKEALADAEDELRQAIHGSDDFKSSLDGLVNYTNKLEELDKSIEKIKESLEDVANIDEAKGLLTQLNEQYDNKIITIGAENIAIDAALSNLQSTLLQNYGNYISFDEKGNPLIDFAYITMDANDEIRKAFEEEYNLYNEYKEKKENNLNTIEKIEQEKLERREESLNNFVKVQEDVISILKEQAKEEIDTTKDKYDALEEADNDYIEALEEAIEKQRKLRDQQNQYEDLATKEKKLSLLQRDTSGANRKEVLSLESEIQDDRQNLLDNEVDNIIESMKELYEKQKEARDAEIEYMEEITENAQYFAEWASNIMSTWQSVEDMQAWYLENDPNAQDMTVEQTEVYLNEIGEKYSDYVQYIATLATDFTTEQEELNSAINQMYENTSNNVENIGTITQETAQNAANEIIEQATKARDDARDKLQETQDKITETQNKIAETNQKIAEAQQKLGEAEQAAINAHSIAMREMINASQSAMKEVSAYATKTLADMLGVDLSNEEQALEFANKYGFVNQNGYVTQNFRDAVGSAGGDISKYQTYQIGQDSYKVFVDPGHGASQTIKTFSRKEDAEAFIKDNNANYSQVGGLHMATNAMDIKSGSFHFIEWGDGTRTWYGTKKQAEIALEEEKKKKNSTKVINGAKAYKQGGLVDYTGPAWVDGSKYKPESFLNADDTKRIGEAAKILADIPIFNSTSNAQNAVSTNIGDTSIEIHINVEKIDSDYDVDQMFERIKQDIVDVSNPIGTPVILRK